MNCYLLVTVGAVGKTDILCAATDWVALYRVRNCTARPQYVSCIEYANPRVPVRR